MAAGAYSLRPNLQLCQTCTEISPLDAGLLSHDSPFLQCLRWKQLCTYVSVRKNTKNLKRLPHFFLRVLWNKCRIWYFVEPIWTFNIFFLVNFVAVFLSVSPLVDRVSSFNETTSVLVLSQGEHHIEFCYISPFLLFYFLLRVIFQTRHAQTPQKKLSQKMKAPLWPFFPNWRCNSLFKISTYEVFDSWKCLTFPKCSVSSFFTPFLLLYNFPSFWQTKLDCKKQLKLKKINKKNEVATNKLSV